MRRFVVALACTVFIGGLVESARLFSNGALAQDGERTDRKELAALQGTWKLLRLEEGGQLVESNLTYKIDGHHLNDGARIHIHASTEPKHMDIEFAPGRKDMTIYVRAGDYLIQCGNRDGQPRPTRFATGGVEGGGAYMIVWKIER